LFAWQKTYQQSYLLGDNDSRLSAKRILIQQLQIQAAQEAGTYIQAQSTLVNDQLNEKITATATALVKVNIVQEQFSTQTNGQQRLFLELEAHIDEQEMLQLFNKQQELQQLSQKVEQLEQKLNQLPSAPVITPSANPQKSFWGE
jgi:hypothetical protein